MKFGHLLRSRGVLLAVPVVVAAIAAVAFYDGDDEPRPGATTTSTTRLSGDPTPTSGAAPEATTSSSGPAGTASSTTATEPAGPAAPWRGATLPRGRVPEPFLDAWERARNRQSCGLLVPADTGPLMVDPEAAFEPTPDNGGWDIFLRDGAKIVEILGLFSRESQPEEPRPAAFSKVWSDGSVARYSADDPGAGAPADPESTAFEATLEIPDQGCVYLIYDTLGKSHLEYVLERLRFAEGTR